LVFETARWIAAKAFGLDNWKDTDEVQVEHFEVRRVGISQRKKYVTTVLGQWKYEEVKP
jgi:hypothetical protein